MVHLAGSFIIHMPLLKLTEQFAWSSLLIDTSVNAISGAYTASLNSVFVCLDSFGKSIQMSPTPIALIVLPSAVAMSWLSSTL